MKIKDVINWKVYFILLITSLLSVIAIFPYIISVQGDMLRKLPLSIPIILIISLIQNGILFALLIFLGLYFSKKVGLGTRYLDQYILDKKITSQIKSIAKKSILWGLITGIIIIILDFVFKNNGVDIGGNLSVPLWQGFLASFYGGIVEEVILRLFFMTSIIWLLHKLSKSKTIINNNFIIWSAIIISAIIFGIGHLPIVASITSLTFIVIFRTILLNSIGGIAFGYLYWKDGLEFSIIAHFTTDIMIQIILPIFILLF